MGIRFPLKDVLGYNQTTENGAGVAGVNASVAGGQALAFNLPQDCDNVAVKLSASIAGGGVSATFQTTDDGGTTWFDVQRSSVVSNAALPVWLNIPVVGDGMRVVSSTVATGSVQTIATTINNVNASTLAINENSGMPVVGTRNRIFLRYSSGITSIINLKVNVYANSESYNA